jgi:predicted AlkP superfamily phosphohydrolase/phosphomutase
MFAFVASTALLLACGGSEKLTGQRVLVLGIDGMDPKLVKTFIARGALPNIQKLIEIGDFKQLTSSIPPQSPVAWSNFITGSNPGKHGIFDFIHRDPKKYSPYLSTTMTEEPDQSHSLVIGRRVVWLKGGTIKLLRRGRAFWQDLAAAGIRERVYKIPSNFPPEEGEGWSSSGMGTPDMLGTYGNFTFFTDAPPEHAKEVYGGTITPVFPNNNVIETEIIGPPNTFLLDERRPYLGSGESKHRNYASSNIPFTIYIDADNPAVKIEVQDRETMLEQGEWSGWVPIVFKMWPHLVEVKGMVRFYLKSVRPNFQLYMSPVNMDPIEPPLPVSNPSEYFADLAEEEGYFYTQGMPENTKARQANLDVLDDAELFDQMMLVHREDLRNFRRHLAEFHDGFLFFYFGSLDLGTHMFWRLHDWQHPAFDPNSYVQLGDPVELLYRKMDVVVGMAMKTMDDKTTLIVMSDHGFAPWYRSFQVNSWLLANGYIKLLPGVKQEDVDMLADASGNEALDWSRTSAYNLGINSVYINLQGREKNGAVSEAERRPLVDEIAKKLEEYVDPATGEHPILHAYKAYEVYHGGAADTAPDLILGYRRGWRGGDDSALGEMPTAITDVNMSSWSGDHCMDTVEVPGSIVASRKILKPDPALIDLGPTVLKLFGLPVPADMDGKPVF